MALSTRTIPALNNGVSRQPAILRSQDQTEAEVNTWGQIATGVSRRPPLRHVADLGELDLNGAHVHHINRDTSERYIVIIKQGGIRVFDQLTGTEHPVSAPSGWGYLDQPTDTYRAVTVADYTFIVNTAKVPHIYTPPEGSDPGTPPPDNPGAVDPGGPRSTLPCYKYPDYDPRYCGNNNDNL